MLNYILARYGLKPFDIQPISVGAGASHSMALERGSIDVGLAIGTTASHIGRRYPDVVTLFDLASPEDMKRHLGVEEFAPSVLYAKTDWMREHPDSLRRIARATLRAADWARTHSPDEGRARLPESIRTEDAAVDLDAIRSMVGMLSPDRMFPPEHVESARRILSVSHESLRNSAVDPSAAYTNKFVMGARQ